MHDSRSTRLCRPLSGTAISIRLSLVLIVSISLFSTPLFANGGDELTGVWEIGSLGADRTVKVWQEGDKFTAYRVLYPEFEGESYKLEHIFKGKIVDSEISGKMHVKEEGMRSFDYLRSFIGKIKENGKIMLDGMTLERQDEELTSKPPVLKPKKRRYLKTPKVSSLLPWLPDTISEYLTEVI